MKKSEGFTLMEVLIAMSLFTVSAVIASSVLVDIVQLQKKSSIQNSVYRDARTIMQQLTNLVQSGTIDYEEYYSVKIVQRKKAVNAGAPYYGINYGVYSSRFFEPGKRQDGKTASNPADLGVECSYPSDPSKECEVYYSDSTDLNTGQNPYKDGDGMNQSGDAAALCDAKLGMGCNGISGAVDELYLIDSSGLHKTILGLKLVDGAACGNEGSDCAIGMIKMTGRDMDQNGVTDVFSCDDDYNCVPANDEVDKIEDAFKYPFIADCVNLKTCASPQSYLFDNKIKLPQQSDLQKAFKIDTSQFVPITPSRVNVKALSFTINPIDDPYKAYSETAMQTQPTVTITMTLGLSAQTQNDYPGTFPDITLQTTVAAGVIGKIDSYPPVNDILRNDGKPSWVDNVF